MHFRPKEVRPTPLQWFAPKFAILIARVGPSYGELRLSRVSDPPIEVIATAKSLIWPYYAVVGFGSGRSSTETRSDVHYLNSKRACKEAFTIVNRFDSVTTLPPKEASQAAQLLKAAVTEAELVDNAYLQRVHPEFLRRYRDEYIGSLRSYAESVRTGDQVRLISAQATYNSFVEWMNAHSKDLNFP